MYNIGLASLHPLLLVPVSNLPALPLTHFASQICLVLSLLLLIVVQHTPLYHLKLCSNMGCCWKHVIKCLFSLLMAHKLYLIPFIVLPWLFVILEPRVYLLWLNVTLFHLYLMVLGSDLTGLTLATPILIGCPVLYRFEYLVSTVSWLLYLVMLLCMLILLFRTPFAKRLTVVQLLGLHLSTQ